MLTGRQAVYGEEGRGSRRKAARLSPQLNYCLESKTGGAAAGGGGGYSLTEIADPAHNFTHSLIVFLRVHAATNGGGLA